jgi:hypothetical protein
MAGSQHLANLWSAAVDKSISAPTVRRRLQQLGLKSYTQKRKPFLSKSQIIKRLEWSTKMLFWGMDQWTKVVWSDESHFLLINRKSKVHVRRLSHEGNAQFNFQPRKQGGGGSVSVWGCFTAAGPGPLIFYEGRLNAARYIDVIRDSLPPFIAASFDLRRDQWFFQQDNAPCHRAKSSTDWFYNNAITVLDWPPASADMNPIENIWSIIDYELTKLPIHSLNDLKREILRLWMNLDCDMCHRLVASVPQRVSLVYKCRGKNISQY